MARIATLVSGLALVVGLLVLAPGPAHAEDTCGPGWPQGRDAVRGQAWSGEVLGIEYHDARRFGALDTAIIRIRVERVYRDHPRVFVDTIRARAGSIIELRADACSGRRDLGMQVGARYLVSTRGVEAWRHHVETGGTAAWRLSGSEARFVRNMYKPRYRDDVWPGFAEADTLDEVLAIVAPSAPATDTDAGSLAGAPVSPQGAAWWPALLAGIAGAGLALRRTRRERG